MRYLSLFSGIEAASVAWAPLGWEPVAFSDIDPFASAVLAERFPDVPNLGDITAVDWREFGGKYGAIDVLVGGSPCQSFSIAGDRTGLDGASGLMWEYVRAVRELNGCGGGVWPRYVVWENVPGCLSSGEGRDFGCLLDALEDVGYNLAWRTLDAQFVRVPDRNGDGWFGPVAQRRRRVFLVGCLGGVSPVEVLVERESLRGRPPSSREARAALAAEARDGAQAAGFNWGEAFDVGYRIEQAPTLKTKNPPAVVSQYGDVAAALTASASGICADRGPTIVCMTDTQADTSIGDTAALTAHSAKDPPVVLKLRHTGSENVGGGQGAQVGEDVCNRPADFKKVVSR